MVDKKNKAKKLGYVGSKPEAYTVDRDSDSWYTPTKYIDDALTVFGGEISLDPFSSDLANSRIKAKKFFTITDNGLEQEWIPQGNKTIWMNPPYGRLMTKAVLKFCSVWDKKEFEQAIVLCNNATDTKWFKLLSMRATAFCFTDHRIDFEAFDGKTNGANTRGQCFIYFGKNTSNFKDIFAKHGLILFPN